MVERLTKLPLRYRIMNALEVLRGEFSAPTVPALPDDALCACGRHATEQWYPNVCAMIGRDKEWKAVCTECDIELNRFTLTTLYGNTPETQEILAEYSAIALLKAGETQ